MFQIAAAAYYCEKYNYTLFLDKTSESLIGGTANKFNRQQQNKSYFNTIYKNLFTMSRKHKDFDFKTKVHNDYTDNKIVPDNGNILVDGWCQNINLFYEVKDKLSNYFNFTNLNTISYINSKYNIKKDNINVMVGLRLDTDGGFKYSNLTIKSYKFIMNKIISENSGKKIKFYVICDIVPPINLFKNESFDITYVKEDDVTQMYVGIECSHYILGESTFHYWMAVLSKNSQDAKVYVFNNTDITNRNFHFPEWNVVDQAEDDFVFIKNVDQSREDLRSYEYSVPILKEIALNEPECAGFNTMGWLKKEILSFSRNGFGPNEGLYVKKNYTPKIENGIKNIEKIYVIHYKKLVERKAHILEEFKKHNITNFEFIDIDRDELQNYDVTIFEKNYSKSQIAITLSHLSAYKEIVAKYNNALILEDDAILAENFSEKLNSYLAQIPETYDMVFLGDGCGMHIESQFIVPNLNVYDACIRKDGVATRCTDSYIVSKNCAKKIMNYIENLPYKIRNAVDAWLNIVIRDNNLNVYWTEPTIVNQGTQYGKFQSSHGDFQDYFQDSNLNQLDKKIPFVVKYGTKNANIDITTGLYLKFTENNIITIPKFDWYRPQVFSDPAIGFKKSIFIIDANSNEVEYTNDNKEICIDLNTNSVYEKD